MFDLVVFVVVYGMVECFEIVLLECIGVELMKLMFGVDLVVGI